MARALHESPESRRQADASEQETATAVAAHSLLQSVSVILAAAEMIQTHGAMLGQARQDELFDLIGAQGRHIAGVLIDMVRGVSPEVLAVLDELRPAPPAASLGLVPAPIEWD